MTKWRYGIVGIVGSGFLWFLLRERTDEEKVSRKKGVSDEKDIGIPDSHLFFDYGQPLDVTEGNTDWRKYYGYTGNGGF